MGTSILGLLFLTAFTAPSSAKIIFQDENEITATITKNTTEENLENLKEFFLKYDIELVIKKVNYNDHNEITGLSLLLKKGESESDYSAFSNQPIKDLELGYKNEKLFISNNEVFDIAAWKDQSNFTHPSFKSLDSIMRSGGFGIDMADLKDQIMNSMSIFENMEDVTDTNSLQEFLNGTESTTKKFRFKNDPNLDKLIIIDGKESDFETLDQLAREDKLETVDFLKPATAVSIYGDKAKDGAVIAITKR